MYDLGTAKRPRAYIVADLGFGDSGKGLVTDYLVGAHAAGAVVRWNGGAQAGHNVVTTDGRHHCFSQFGAGSFHPGVLTLHTRDVVVHPTALRVEAEQLARVGVGDALSRLCLHAESRVITPFHQAVGRLRELRRGGARHGSCGIGFGETVATAIAAPELAFRVADLQAPLRARAKLQRIRELEREVVAEWLPEFRRMAAAESELEVLESTAVLDRWLALASEAVARASVLSDAELAARLNRIGQRGPLVLEGAQGMLLDEWHGLYPHTTWSDCRVRAAGAELARLGFMGEVTRVGVVRSYSTRHGEGPLPTYESNLDALPEPHNSPASWQGAFRRGWQDLTLLRHAARTGGKLDMLVVTHLDTIEQLPEFYVSDGYQLEDGRSVRDLAELCGEDPERRRPEPEQLAAMERVTRALTRARPKLRAVEGSVEARRAELIRHLQSNVGAARVWGSYGPSANHLAPYEPTDRHPSQVATDEHPSSEKIYLQTAPMVPHPATLI